MKKMFDKKINKKSFYAVFLIFIALLLSAIFAFNIFQNTILSRIGFSDFAALGSAGQDIVETADNLNSYVSPKVYDDDMCVHFINVGKADCAYIKCKNVHILIDAADREPTDTVVEYLKRQKVEKLDMVVMSHPHRDHIGQMASVIREFKVDKFIEADMPKDIISTTWTYEKMLKALIDKQVPVKSVLVGQKFEIGDLKIDVLGPVRVNRENLNDNSVVMKITYKNVSFLFTGDASRAEEKDIIKHYGLDSKGSKGADKNSIKKYENITENNKRPDNPLKSNVLKVGHHGSHSSSTEAFLKLIKPDYAVISTASRENTGLPANWRWRALERLQKYCGKIYKTYESGNIVFLTDGDTVKVETEK